LEHDVDFEAGELKMTMKKSLATFILASVAMLGMSGCYHHHRDYDHHPPPPPRDHDHY
jgi:hypothetical protein